MSFCFDSLTGYKEDLVNKNSIYYVYKTFKNFNTHNLFSIDIATITSYSTHLSDLFCYCIK